MKNPHENVVAISVIRNHQRGVTPRRNASPASPFLLVVPAEPSTAMTEKEGM